MYNPVKSVAAVFALAGFAVATISGAATGNTGPTVLAHACISLVLCYLLGAAVGAAGHAAVDRHLHAYRAARPITEPVAAQSTPSPQATNSVEIPIEKRR